jgi:hypothetical protein
MRPPNRLLCSLMCVFLAPTLAMAADTMLTATLRPTPSALETNAQQSLAIPFYQAIPFAAGTLQPSEIHSLQTLAGLTVPAQVTTAARWPDGSVRWLAVDGVWPSELPLSQAVEVQVSEEPHDSAAALPQAVIHTLSVEGDEVHLLSKSRETVVVLTPQAAYMTISEPKQILPDSIPDTERQYAWAEPLDALNPQGKSTPLDLRIRDCAIETENDLFTTYRLRGNGGDQSPGAELEWQLRVRIYHVTPVVRLQMSWSLHWDPESFALTSARWLATSAAPLSQVYIPEVDPPLDAAQAAVQICVEPSGHSKLVYQGTDIDARDWPEPEWHSLTARTGDTYLGLGTVNLTRLGPNHIALHDDTIELASWSADLGYGLDLRSSALLDEFGMDPADGRSTAIGVTRTLESSLVWAASAAQAQSLADLEARRDTLWLPNRTDITRAQALGPWNEGTFFSNSAFFEGLDANLHFLLASRDHWRWNGWANFGDMRTNFASATQAERGLHVQRWALHGRYGWRNGSAAPCNGMWWGGLALEDRELCLAAIDYALHVADTDVSHPSFYGPPQPTDGGMHRRNKDHWSGSVQMQYTPNDYLYLTHWLTGHERLRETLEEVRDYATRQGKSGSVFAGQAWVHRYMETHDPDDLQMARRLLDESTGAWQQRSGGSELTGLSALYSDNFRLTLDGIPVLIQFYEATGDVAYLEAIRGSMQAQGLPDRPVPSLAEYHGLAYLLLNGYTEEQVGPQLVAQARQHVSQVLFPREIPLKGQWDYPTLEDVVLHRLLPASHPGYLETLAITLRGTMAPIVIHAFGLEPREMALHGPKNVYVGRSGPGEAILSIERLHDQEALSGYLEIKDVPEDLRLASHRLEYAIEPGTKEFTLPLVLEATPALAPGAYTLSVMDPKRSELTATLPVVLPGWRLVDDFRPPMKDSWFGSFSFEVAEGKSGGWQHGTSDVFDDPDWLRRIEPTTEYLIYDTPGLYDFSLTFYAPAAAVEQVADQIAFDFATDADTWKPIPTELAWTRHGTHAKAVITTQERVFRGDGKLRLSVSAGGDAAYPRLGYLEIRGWH